MADPFAEFERELEQQGLQQPGGIPVTPQQTGTPSTLKSVKGDPFARLQTELEQPYSGMNALTGGYIRDIPIVGPTIESAAQNVAADIRSRMSGTPKEEELKTVQDFAARSLAGNPGLATAGGLAGNTATFGALGATGIGARALGATGGNLAARSATGGATGAALGAADAAARGQDPVAGGVVGGVVGGAAPSFGGFIRNIISPFNPPTATVARTARQPSVDVLENAGVRLPAGDVTGSPAVQNLEDIMRYYPGIGGRQRNIIDKRDMQFTSSVLDEAGFNVPNEGVLATPKVIQEQRDKLDSAFKAVSGRTTVQTNSRPFQNDISAVIQNYGQLLPVDQQKRLYTTAQQLQYGYLQGMPGDIYQKTRTSLRRTADEYRNARDGSDTDTSLAFRNLGKALDDAMARSVSPADRDLWQQTQRQWGMLRTVENAMSGTDKRTRQGFLEPGRLEQAIRVRNPSAFARGGGSDLTELAQAGGAILRPLPESGTGRQAITTQLLTGATGGVLGAGAGAYNAPNDQREQSSVLGGLTGAATGFAGPYALGRVIQSPVGQAYLRNTLLSSPAATRAISGPLQEAFLPARLPKTLRDLGE